ncbi:hypothetical protein HBB16_13390 [Pseudonocardia sp. MCCB 268]|nr:hypothetical protein [Pseudonocardia cytotoxica]
MASRVARDRRCSSSTTTSPSGLRRRPPCTIYEPAHFRPAHSVLDVHEVVRGVEPGPLVLDLTWP